MSEKNPRSKLGSMKRQYFLTSFGMLVGIFLLIYLPSEILFTIFEAGPYMRLTMILAMAVFDLVLVNYLVNVRWKDKWLRQMPVVEDVIKAPAPEYVMDEETARKLEASRQEKNEKQNNNLFSRFYRFLSPAEESQSSAAEGSSSASASYNREGTRAVRPHIDQAASSLQQANVTETSLISESSHTGSWKTPIEELATAEYDDVVKALRQAGETIKPEVETKPVNKVPSRMERKRQKEQEEHRHSKMDETVNPVTDDHPKQEYKKHRTAIPGTNRNPEPDAKKGRRSAKKQHEKKRKKPRVNHEQTETTAPISSGASWSTPLDEMRTEELETAVENAMKQGYNPISDERNK